MQISLWKVDIPWDSDNNLGKLELLRTRSPNEDIIIQELGSKLLYPSVDIGDIFTQDSKDIRIMQPPSPAGKRRLEEDEESGSRKREKRTYVIPDESDEGRDKLMVISLKDRVVLLDL